MAITSGIELYRKRLKELEEDPIVREYLYFQKLIVLAESKAYNMRVNAPERVIPDNIIKLDKIEKEEDNVILKLLRWSGKASTVNEINKLYHEFYFEETDLKYKIRHQFKKGNLCLLSYNESRKYSFYIMPEWIKNGVLPNNYYPTDKNVPLTVESINIRSDDNKININLKP